MTDNFKVEVKELKSKSLDQKQERCPLKLRLPYISSNPQSVETHKLFDIKEQIQGVQGLLKSINKQMDQKQHSLQILKQQSLVSIIDKENKNRSLVNYSSIRLNTYESQESQPRYKKKRLDLKSDALINQTYKTFQLKQDQQKQINVDSNYTQKSNIPYLRENQLQYQDINLYQTVQKEILRVPDGREKVKKCHKKQKTEQYELQEDLKHNQIDQIKRYGCIINFNSVICQKDQDEIQNKKNQHESQFEYPKMQKFVQHSKLSRIKSPSSINIVIDKTVNYPGLFDNQIILKLFQSNSKQQQEQTQEELKQSLKKCNEQMRQVINQSSLRNSLNKSESSSNFIKTESTTLNDTQSTEKELTLPERLRRLLAKKQEMEGPQKNQHQTQSDYQNNALSDSQQYFYQPKLISRYSNNKSTTKASFLQEIKTKKNLIGYSNQFTQE